MKYLQTKAALLVLILLVTGATGLVWQITAQDDPEAGDDLVTENVEVVAAQDIYGQPVLAAEGRLLNQGESAYSSITLIAEVYDADGELIGEGIGYPINQCGVGLLPDFALQPDSAQPFSIALELYEDGAEVERVEVLPQGEAVEPTTRLLPEDLIGITSVTNEEVVQVEWVDATTLRYGVGCDQDVFTRLTWYQYNLESGESTPIEHPAAAQVTDALLTQLGLTDPFWLNHSFLAFPLTSRRILYQTDINTVLSAEADGSFKRLIWDNLARLSLHGFIWLPEGRFLAYYYGAYGEEVRYFTASVEGQRISASVYDVLPSLTIPGPTPDGARVVITTTVDGVTGYYLKDALYAGNELLFEAEPPGNNWPAPIYTVDSNNQARIYITRPLSETPTLQCFDVQTRELGTLTAVPLDLSFDDRAWTWLSPDATQIALAANGANGGLWLIDLSQLGNCAAPLAG
jgi:hypothetical protein